MKRLLPILLLCCCVFRLSGQTDAQLTSVIGSVTDAATGEPIAGVSVYFEGTSHGIVTDKDGNFLLRAPLSRRGTVAVSAIGYHTERFRVEAGAFAAIEVVLRESVSLLNDIEVLPRFNPALALLDSVRRYRTANDIAPRTDNAEEQTTVFLSHLRTDQLRRLLGSDQTANLPVAADSSSLLPVYTCHWQGEEQTAQAMLFNTQAWDILTGTPYDTPDFYRSTVSIAGNAFVTPLAAGGRSYYHYAITDSVQEMGKAYRLTFWSKNPYQPTFNGSMLIDSATYALREVTADIPKETNVNYLRRYHLHQVFEPMPQGTYRVKQCLRSHLMDYAFKLDTTHTYPSLLVETQTDYTAAEERPQDTLRHPTQQEAYDSPLLRTVNFFAQTILTGYIPTGTAVDIGRVSEILQFNPLEKVRVGLPFRTNDRMSRHICLEAYAAYGFGDRAWKGSGQIHAALPTARRHILSLGYTDTYIATDADEMTRLRRENSVWYRDRSLTTNWTEPFFRGKDTHIARARRCHFHVNTEHDWADGVESMSYFSIGMQHLGTPTQDYTLNPSFGFACLGTTFRLSWDERKVDLYFRRIHVYNHLPVLYLNGEMGSIHYDGRSSYDMYAKLRVMLRQRVPLGIAGQLDYLVEGGCIVGKAPDVFLYSFEGNQSYAFDPYAFTLMNYHRYQARHYLSVHANWNGHGCLFNLIPGIRVLHLRELVTMKVAYGGDLNIPYAELGIGIGNILRVAELYSVWRLSHRNDAGATNWAMRFRLHIDT